MAETYYPASQVDPVHQNLLDLAEAAVEQAKKAQADLAKVSQELAALKAAPPAPRVVLQKVASQEKLDFDQTILGETLDVLERMDFLDAAGRSEVVLHLTEDPNYALKLAARIATLSAPAPSMGRGFPKSAAHKGATNSQTSVVDDEPDPWLDVIHNGAA